METRELFERLIADEPPLRLSPTSAIRDGRRAATHRWSSAAAGAVAVVVVFSGVVVELASGHQATSLAHPTHTATARPVPTTMLPALASGFPESLNAASLPFVSLAQVQEAA